MGGEHNGISGSQYRRSIHQYDMGGFIKLPEQHFHPWRGQQLHRIEKLLRLRTQRQLSVLPGVADNFTPVG